MHVLLGQNTLHTTLLRKGQLLKHDLTTQCRPGFWAAGLGHGRPLAAALCHRPAPPRPPCTHRRAHIRLRTHRPFTTPPRSSAEPTAAQFRLRPFRAGAHGPRLFFCASRAAFPGQSALGFPGGDVGSAVPAERPRAAEWSVVHGSLP